MKEDKRVDRTLYISVFWDCVGQVEYQITHGTFLISGIVHYITEVEREKCNSLFLGCSRQVKYQTTYSAYLGADHAIFIIGYPASSSFQL